MKREDPSKSLAGSHIERGTLPKGTLRGCTVIATAIWSRRRTTLEGTKHPARVCRNSAKRAAWGLRCWKKKNRSHLNGDFFPSSVCWQKPLFSVPELKRIVMYGQVVTTYSHYAFQLWLYGVTFFCDQATYDIPSHNWISFQWNKHIYAVTTIPLL